MSTVTVEDALAQMQQERVTTRKFNANGKSQGTISKPKAPIVNKFPGKCHDCGQWVLEGQGVVAKESQDSKWLIFHPGGKCPEVQVQAPAPVVPKHEVSEGCYFVEGVVYKVQTARSGNLYAKAMVVMDEKVEWLYDGKKHFRFFTAETRLSLEEAMKFGQTHGFCAVCGEYLTAEASMESGIGPICRKRLGA